MSPFEVVFEVDLRLEGPMGRPYLDHLRKLLDLRPTGRLTDTEDMEFGWRTVVPGPPTTRADLVLWRHTPDAWSVRLGARDGARPGEDEVDQCRAEVLGAAAALGLLARVRPRPAAPVRVEADLAPPVRPAVAVSLSGGHRFGGLLSVDPREELQRAFGLRREFGGLSGTEYGWRYVRWDRPGGRILAQLHDRAGIGTDLVLSYDRRPPSPRTVEEFVRTAEGAAARTGMTVERIVRSPA